MRTYNRATIIGRVGNEVVLRYTKSGKAVVNLRLATNERRKDGPETTTWHRVVLWERQAELAEKYLTKGCLVYVEGNLTARDWTDAQGQQYTSLELRAREIIFLDGKAASNPGAEVLPGHRAADGEELQEVAEAIPF